MYLKNRDDVTEILLKVVLNTFINCSNITGLLDVRGEENVDNYKEQTDETPGLRLVFASLSICP